MRHGQIDPLLWMVNGPVEFVMSNDRAAGRAARQRILIAQTAARLMAEGGMRDYRQAKHKALDSLGISRNTPNMPRNTEVEQALAEYQRLFQGESQPRALSRLRETAAEAMTVFADFRPRLVGPVLSGLADTASAVNLHLFADTPEQVVLFLLDRDIPHESDLRRLRVNDRDWAEFPMFRFMARDVPVELTVFPLNGLRQAPLSPVDGRPMQRAGLNEVQELLGRD